MEYTIDITIHDDIMIFDLYKNDRVFRFDLNNQDGRIGFSEEDRATNDEINEVLSYINTSLSTKIRYGEYYPIDDTIIEQLNTIPNCEASRVIDDDRDYMDYEDHDDKSSDDESPWLWGNKTYTSMCEDD